MALSVGNLCHVWDGFPIALGVLGGAPGALLFALAGFVREEG